MANKYLLLQLNSWNPAPVDVGLADEGEGYPGPVGAESSFSPH